MEELVTAAKAEGELTTIALPHDWCNYGGVIEGFKSKYGLKVNELNPDAGSGDELEAIKANKDNKGPQAPDVIDVGFAFGPQAKDEGLMQPYKVSTWDTIPDSAKDADGYWYGDYYGVMAFMVNKDLVTGNTPKTWADLLKDEYKAQVALSGDPRTSNQAILAVQGASVANGGTLEDPTKGLEFFAELNSKGNLVPVIANNALVARAKRPFASRGTTMPWPAPTGLRAIRRWKLSCRAMPASPASTCRPSAPTPPIPTPPSCGWSICTPTKASCSG